ncbi:MAG: hypothetical protein GY750_04710 [Lentisphaerae bacterium]|nr:hypothetical protein [Lentisphaerota bacterium]
MGIRWGTDYGQAKEKNVKYFLRWETLDRNRDLPRKGPVPDSSSLALYKISYK